MRVLILTQVLPYPLDSGPKIKTFHVLKYLAQRHEVTLVSFVRGDQSRQVEALRKYCRQIYTVQMPRSTFLDAVALFRSVISGLPWMVIRDDVKEMRQLLQNLTTTQVFDVVHADQLNMAQYTRYVNAPVKVLDEHNALWLLYKRLAETIPQGFQKVLLNRDWKLIKKYEGSACREFDYVLAVTDEDCAALEEAMGKKKEIIVIPIAIDPSEILPVERASGADHIVHIGTMFWPPNVDGILWFAREIYPLIQAEKPGVIFDIVGARPPVEVVDLARIYPGINVTGYIEDPIDYYRRAGVMIVPLRAGGGMRVKILIALAQALPIVTTSLGCEGIKVEHREHLLIADRPREFAEAVLQLLDQPDYAERLGQNGLRLVREKYDCNLVCSPLDIIYAG